MIFGENTFIPSLIMLRTYTPPEISKSKSVFGNLRVDSAIRLPVRELILAIELFYFSSRDILNFFSS